MSTKFNTILKRAVISSLSLVILMASACKKDQPVNQNSTRSLSFINYGSTSAPWQKRPLSVCYVEVNNNDISELGKYTLTNGRKLFDIGIIFAANINYNTTTKKAELFFNPQVSNVLTNFNTKIRPLQDKGIAVLLSVLGNHQGAGFANFPDSTSAQAFALQLSNAVTTYGLDGSDLDDEYAEYGNNGTGNPNSSSFIYLVTALRKLMPTKIISFYNIGPSSYNSSYNGVTVASKVNYVWNPYYGQYFAPYIPGLSNNQLGAAAIEIDPGINQTDISKATNFAAQTVKDGYGVYLYYNLTNSDVHTYLSSISNALYGQSTIYTNKPAPHWPEQLY